MGSTPEVDQIHHLTHYYTISYHKSCFEGRISSNLLQPVDPSGELLHDGLAVVSDVEVPLNPNKKIPMGSIPNTDWDFTL